MSTDEIVVGVDGSPNSIAALRWAWAVAKQRAATLVAVTVQEPIAMYGAGIGAGVAATKVYEAALDSASHALEGYVTDAIPDGAERAKVKRRVLSGPPAKSLLTAGADASLLVLGARGRGGFAGLRLGSVASQVTHHATVPTAIIPAGCP